MILWVGWAVPWKGSGSSHLESSDGSAKAGLSRMASSTCLIIGSLQLGSWITCLLSKNRLTLTCSRGGSEFKSSRRAGVKVERFYVSHLSHLPVHWPNQSCHQVREIQGAEKNRICLEKSSCTVTLQKAVQIEMGRISDLCCNQPIKLTCK